MPDTLIRSTAGGGTIRAIAATTTDLVEEARRRHNAYPTAAAALGRALTAAALLGATLKDKQTLTLRVEGDGPLGGLTAEADAAGNLRGYVRRPHVHLPIRPDGKVDVGGAVGQGSLCVIRDLGLKELYTGSAALVTGEIGEDVAHYLMKSEQTPSAVGLGVLVGREGEVEAAGGYLLQLLPAVDDAARERLEENLGRLGAVSASVHAGARADDVLAGVLQGFDCKVLARQPLCFQCRCSAERARDILVGLGAAELQSLLEERGEAELTCHFCGDVYRFGRADLQRLITMAGKETT